MSAAKIVSLNKHVEKLRNMKTSIPERRRHQSEEFLKWVNLEISRTEKKLESLALSMPTDKKK